MIIQEELTCQDIRKWASIKHKKAATDSKRGAAFTKMIREITAHSQNRVVEIPRRMRDCALRLIEREALICLQIISKTRLKREQVSFQASLYEEVPLMRMVPAVLLMYIVGLTDNKNRTTAEIRNILSKKNGSLAGPGATARIYFTKKGFISIEKDKIGEDELMDIAIRGRCGRFYFGRNQYHEITSDINSLQGIKDAS